MDPLRDTIERALGAQYDVLRLIGRGGMGAVYLARERLIERLVAVKVLPHEAATQHGGRERFLREARTAARLSHPNIVPLHSFAEADGTFLYVMGFVEGESLEARLARDGKIGADEARRILAEIAEALDYAHAQGVVHRDVKPDNILIEATTGRAVLTDFGIAKHGASGSTLTQTGMIVGTPHYMSPEQASAGSEVDGRTDIYALGVIGYRMISGRLPFEGASVHDVLKQQVMRDPVPLTQTEDSAGLTTAVMRCLEKDPRDRWPTAAGLALACRAPDDQEVELPYQIEHVPSFGTRAAFLIYGASLLTLLYEVYVVREYSVTTRGDVAHQDVAGTLTMRLLGGLSALSGVLFVYSGLRAKRWGVPFRNAFKLMFWPVPGWWGWWPMLLRRPGDVWARLPKTIRIGRTMLTAAIVGLLGVIPGGASYAAWWLEHTYAPPFWFGLGTGLPMLMILSVVLVLIPYALSLLRWHKRFRLPAGVIGRLHYEPTWNNAKFWQRPEIARILEPAVVGQSRSTPRTPADYVAAIAEAVAALPEAIRPALSDVSDTVRELARYVTAIDTELAELSREADPAERGRLQQKLAAMGSRGGQLRELLVGQIALLDTLEARRRQLGDDRERYVALLKSVWLQIASLRAESTQASLSAAEITGRVRALRDELARQRSARAEVEHMMLGNTVPSGDPV